MKALVLKAYHQLAWEEAPDPEVGPSEALIQVKACGICGSDVHGLDGSTGRRIPPLIMGHEAAGMIARVGKDVTDWKVGERVTFDSTIYCGRCAFCLQGRINLCDNRRVLGVSCAEYRQHGAFAEYVVVPERILYRLPAALSFERAAMVEALAIAAHAVGRLQVRRQTKNRGADLAFEAVGLSATLQMALAGLRKGGAAALIGNLSPLAQLPSQMVVTRELAIHGSSASCGEYPICLELIARGAADLAPLISAVAPLSEGPSWFKRLYGREPGLMKVILTA